MSSQDRRTLSALAALLPAGTLGLSVSLAAADAKAVSPVDPATKKPGSVAERLQTIRESVSGAIDEHKFLKVDPDSVTLEDGYSRDVRQIGHWGTGDLELTLRTVADFERSKSIIHRSYAEN